MGAYSGIIYGNSIAEILLSYMTKIVFQSTQYLYKFNDSNNLIKTFRFLRDRWFSFQ